MMSKVTLHILIALIWCLSKKPI